MPTRNPHHFGQADARRARLSNCGPLVLTALLTLLGLPTPTAAQHVRQIGFEALSPPQTVLREHEVAIPAGIAAAGFAVYVVYGIATAPRSARQYNELHPDLPSRSSSTALLLSLGATAVPLAVGAAMDGGAPVAAAGIVFGPSAGHWYAGMDQRAWTQAAIRAVVVLAGGIAWSQT